MSDSMRIGRVLSRLGVCSRRDADSFLRDNDVRFQDERIIELNTTLDIAILKKLPLVINGTPHALPEQGTLLLLHKPQGYVCSHREQRGQKSIFRLLPEEYNRLYFAGRLDEDSEGLVVLSNDGDLIYQLTHPSAQTEKKYLVVTSRPVSPSEEKQAMRGITDKGERLRFANLYKSNDAELCARVDHKAGSPVVYEVILTEGKKREIRRVFARFGIDIVRLIRLEMGALALGDIPSGSWQNFHTGK